MLPMKSSPCKSRQNREDAPTDKDTYLQAVDLSVTF